MSAFSISLAQAAPALNCLLWFVQLIYVYCGYTKLYSKSFSVITALHVVTFFYIDKPRASWVAALSATSIAVLAVALGQLCVCGCCSRGRDIVLPTRKRGYRLDLLVGYCVVWAVAGAVAVGVS